MDILVIDDEMVMRSLVTIAMQRSGYNVVNIEDPLQALDYLKTSVPDCIILDIMMPGIDGLDLCRRIRRYTATIPIVIFSALGDENSIQNAYKAGANAFMHKLRLPHELAAVVEQTLQAGPHILAH
jgi:two-component system response regulator MtrA